MQPLQPPKAGQGGPRLPPLPRRRHASRAPPGNASRTLSFPPGPAASFFYWRRGAVMRRAHILIPARPSAARPGPARSGPRHWSIGQRRAAPSRAGPGRARRRGLSRPARPEGPLYNPRLVQRAVNPRVRRWLRPRLRAVTFDGNASARAKRCQRRRGAAPCLYSFSPTKMSVPNRTEPNGEGKCCSSFVMASTALSASPPPSSGKADADSPS